jgi:hypothetical protein
MFFADLTPYTYGLLPKQQPWKDVLNVGWLSCEHPFTTGELSSSFSHILQCLISWPVFDPIDTGIAMGYHGCEFCSPLGAEEPASGTGELWVPGAGRLIYVAPTLVAHYVEAHRYLPPQEFIEAVLAFQDTLTLTGNSSVPTAPPTISALKSEYPEINDMPASTEVGQSREVVRGDLVKFGQSFKLKGPIAAARRYLRDQFLAAGWRPGRGYDEGDLVIDVYCKGPLLGSAQFRVPFSGLTDVDIDIRWRAVRAPECADTPIDR